MDSKEFVSLFIEILGCFMLYTTILCIKDPIYVGSIIMAIVLYTHGFRSGQINPLISVAKYMLGDQDFKKMCIYISLQIFIIVITIYFLDKMNIRTNFAANL
jgi:glycerol uptake facilitator-like aquaporin